jgi:transcriptional antiterminator NusG
MPEKVGSKWYVIQVRTATEEAMCRKIERACQEHDDAAAEASRVSLRECFSPRYRTQRKWKGEWESVERPLLPGYVIVDTAHPAQLAQAVRSIRGLSRLLSDGETYEPLDDKERAWIERWTGKGERVIPMSFGRKLADGKVQVTEGPLEGCEAEIVSVNRKKSTADLEFHVGPMRIKTKVGLGILPE